MASPYVAGALIGGHGAPYHVGATQAPAAATSSMYMGPMCKVTILSLEAHHGDYAADYSVTFSHAAQEATTNAKRCIAGQGAVWNESIEFPIVAGHDLSFVVEESGKPLAQTLGSASLAATRTGTLDLPIMRNGDIRGILKVNLGVSYPTAPPTAMTVAAAPAAITHGPPFLSSPVASQLRLAVEPTAIAPSKEFAREVPVHVERVLERRPTNEAIQAIPKVLDYAAASGQAPAFVSQQALPMQTVVQAPRAQSFLSQSSLQTTAQTVQPVTVPVPMPVSMVPAGVPPAAEMCKVTVVSLEPVGYVEQITVKIMYNGQEADTPARGVAGGTHVTCNDSIEFPLSGSQDLVFMVEDVGRREVLGAVATPVIPGLIELPVLDEHRALRGKMKVAIRVYSGPPLGALLEELPSTATLPAPPTQSLPPTLASRWSHSESFQHQHQTLPPTLTSGMLPTSSGPLAAAPSFAAVPAWLQRG